MACFVRKILKYLVLSTVYGVRRNTFRLGNNRGLFNLS